MLGRVLASVQGRARGHTLVGGLGTIGLFGSLAAVESEGQVPRVPGGHAAAGAVFRRRHVRGAWPAGLYSPMMTAANRLCASAISSLPSSWTQRTPMLFSESPRVLSGSGMTTRGISWTMMARRVETEPGRFGRAC